MIAEWVRESVSFVANNGLDGVAIDIESTHKDFVSELVDAVCLLKTSLHAAIPGSVVTFTTALGAVEANSSYDFGKLATCLDYISPMMYGLRVQQRDTNHFAIVQGVQPRCCVPAARCARRDFRLRPSRRRTGEDRSHTTAVRAMVSVRSG